MEKIITPILAQWDITSGCNFSCSFCLTNSGKKSSDDVDTTAAKAIVDQLYDGGVMFVRVLGGEPFFRKDMIDIMKYMAKRNMLMSFSTNASLISESIAREIKSLESNINYYQVSLYATNQKDYYDVTQNSQGFKMVLKGIENFKKAGLDPYLFWVLTAENADGLFEAYRIAKDFGLPALRISPKLNLGRGMENCENSLRDPESWGRVIPALQKLHELVRTNKTPIVQLHARPLLGEYLYKLTNLPYFYITCKAATTMVYVNAEGQISPCPFSSYMPETYRIKTNNYDPLNIVDNRLSEVWQSHSFQLYREMQKPHINTKKMNTDCIHFQAGRCSPCIYTPCTCGDTAAMINTAFQNQARIAVT